MVPKFHGDCVNVEKNGGTDSSKLSSSSSGPWPPGLPLEPVTAGRSSLFCWVHHETKFFPELWLTLLELIKLKVFQPVWMSPFSSRYCGQGYFCFQFSISQEMQQKRKKGELIRIWKYCFLTPYGKLWESYLDPRREGGTGNTSILLTC